jgi:hypothetical protein
MENPSPIWLIMKQYTKHFTVRNVLFYGFILLIIYIFIEFLIRNNII